jgi:hypothetical protein
MVVGLKTYKTDNQEIYETLRKMLSGIAFFRKDEKFFYIKSPNNQVVSQFLEINLIEEVI